MNPVTSLHALIALLAWEDVRLHYDIQGQALVYGSPSVHFWLSRPHSLWEDYLIFWKPRCRCSWLFREHNHEWRWPLGQVPSFELSKSGVVVHSCPALLVLRRLMEDGKWEDSLARLYLVGKGGAPPQPNLSLSQPRGVGEGGWHFKQVSLSLSPCLPSEFAV